MNISRENAYGVLAKATRELMTRTVEIRNPLVKGFEIFQWNKLCQVLKRKIRISF
ncbi:hypothetical protein [Enterobacter sp. SECR18-0236]|uniref:hypothetical protein n=1 Tax=Enterobacter sp. SECR18-0236 TaxID=2749083 RepID=UPI002F428865